jgi:hypothetical protein
MGAPKAITETAYKIERFFYMCMKTVKSYKDLGADYYESMYKERVLRNFKHKATALGFSLVPLQILVSQKKAKPDSLFCSVMRISERKFFQSALSTLLLKNGENISEKENLLIKRTRTNKLSSAHLRAPDEARLFRRQLTNKQRK